MKSCRLLSILLFLIAPLSGGAQKIHFTDSGNRWFVDVRDNNGFHRERFFMGRDSLVGNKHYRLLNNQPYGILEDTILQRVYIRYLYTSIPGPDTTDYLLYRYDLHVGDTVRFDGYVYTDSVTSIDSVLINNVYHKVFTLRDKNQNFGMLHAYSFIEGIGCLDAPLYPRYAYCYEAESQVVCFEHNGLYPPMNQSTQNCFRTRLFTNPGTCADSFSLAVLPILDPAGFSAEVSPNPVTSASVIRLSHPVISGRLQILDGMGRVVANEVLSRTQEIPIGARSLPPGNYIWKITDAINLTSKWGRFTQL